jgi:DNA-binding CsgD family transcriptional regulator
MHNADRKTIWPDDVHGLIKPRLPAIMMLEPARLGEEVDAVLSDQQKRVLMLLSEGHANKAIAWVLGIEEATAKAHVSSILKRFQLTNRTQAALLGLRVRLLLDECAKADREVIQGQATLIGAHAARASVHPA